MSSELEAANERIRLLIAERDTARLQADQQYKLREEFLDLLGTDEIEQGVAVVREMQERIKRLEKCTQIAWGIIANVDSGSWGEQRADWREAAIRWRDEQFHPAFRLSEHQAKEAKP